MSHVTRCFAFKFEADEEKELLRIENSVTLLLTKLDAETDILQCLKDQFVLVMDYYLQEVKKIRKYKNLSAKSLIIQDLVNKVKTKLQNMTTRENTTSNNISNFREVSIKKEYLLKVAKKIHSNQIDPKEYKNNLDFSTYWLPAVNNSQWSFEEKNQLHIARIHLKLFLNSPPVKSTEVSNQNSFQSDQIIGNSLSDEKMENAEKTITGNPYSEVDTIEKTNHVKQRPHFKTDKNSVKKRKKEVNDEANYQNSVKSVNEVLNSGETQILEIVRSHATFIEKKEKLEQLKQKIQKIQESNQTIIKRKNEVIDKISCFVIAETAIYSRQKLKTIEDYKSYAEQFALPQRIAIYETRKNEIDNMNNFINCIPDDNKFFQERRHVIKSRINEVLEVLEKKAGENEKIISELEKLESIKNEIPNLGPEVTLSVFNNYRENIENVKGVDSRIINTKLKVLECLHKHEKTFYEKHFKKFLPTVLEFTSKYETVTQQIYCLNLDQNFQELTTQLEDTAATITTKSLPENVHTVFFEQLLKKIEQIKKYISDITCLQRKVDDLLQSKALNPDKISIIKDLEDEIYSLETTTARHSLLKKFQKNKRELLVEKSRLELDSIINNQIKRYKKDVIFLDHIPLVEKIIELFVAKEKIEDVCGEVQELSSQKESVLENIKEILTNLDKEVAICAFRNTPYENVLNVENYFTNLEFDHVPSKETIEFVNFVESHAKTFEYSVKCYLGTKDSIDYYIIHENLMRLLEELDRLECNDDNLLDETVKTMHYIKKLKKDLLANASFQE